MAEMHKVPAEGTPGYTGKFGFEKATHCGVTEQDNRWEDDWRVFYEKRRLGDLVKRIGDSEISKAWEELRAK